MVFLDDGYTGKYQPVVKDFLANENAVLAARVLHSDYRAIKTGIALFTIFLLSFFTKILPISQPSIQSMSCIGSIFIGGNICFTQFMRIIFHGEGNIIFHVIHLYSYIHTPRMFWKEMSQKHRSGGK